jgi:ribosomal protein S18 acetylase RimI-like enzyme
VGDRTAALRIARSAFRSPRTIFSFRRTLVADEGGHAVGQVIRVEGAEWAGLRIPTGVVMLRSAGFLAGMRLLWRGPVEARLMPAVQPDSLYVVSLAVGPGYRSRGIGALLMHRVIEEARIRRLRAVALDVSSLNEGAIRFYRKGGFEQRSKHQVAPARGLPAMGSMRMELLIADGPGT